MRVVHGRLIDVQPFRGDARTGPRRQEPEGIGADARGFRSLSLSRWIALSIVASCGSSSHAFELTFVLRQMCGLAALLVADRVR